MRSGTCLSDRLNHPVLPLIATGASDCKTGIALAKNAPAADSPSPYFSLSPLNRVFTPGRWHFPFWLVLAAVLSGCGSSDSVKAGPISVTNSRRNEFGSNILSYPWVGGPGEHDSDR